MGFTGECIEKVLTSSFGVGGSAYKKGNDFYSANRNTEYVDTVPFGTFRKALALHLGGFDERYPRAEDNDFNHRIRKGGGRILLFKDIHTIYFCRNSVRELIRMGFGNGESIGAVFLKDSGTVSIRHLIPFAFVMSVAGGTLGWRNDRIRGFLGAELAIYGIASILAAVRIQSTVRKTLCIILLFPILHISYGVGTITGLAKEMRIRFMEKRHDRR